MRARNLIAALLTAVVITTPALAAQLKNDLSPWKISLTTGKLTDKEVVTGANSATVVNNRYEFVFKGSGGSGSVSDLR